jgi:hypothetical protein
MSSFFKGILITCIQVGDPEGTVSSQCSSCKSCTSAVPIEVCCAPGHQVLELARHCLAQNWERWRYKVIQVTKHKHWLWNFCKKQWKELVSNQFLQAPLLLPSHQHSKDLNISSWLACSGMPHQLIPGFGTLLLGCCPLRNCNENATNCKLALGIRDLYGDTGVLKVESIFYLHNELFVLHNGVGVKSLTGIKPEIELLFSVAFPLGEHIGMENIWLSSCIAQKLKVDLIVGRPLRR